MTTAAGSRVVRVPGAWVVLAMAPVLVGLALLGGEFDGAVGLGALAVVSSFFLVRSVERSGDELRVRYVGPRWRTIPSGRVLGVTTEAGIWMTRIELRGSSPLVLTGWPRGLDDLVAGD